MHSTTTLLRPARRWTSRLLAFVIEHSPCCLLSFLAAFAGLPFLYHNRWLEFGFAISGAMLGEYLGHRFFHKHEHLHKDACSRDILRRYGFSLLIGLITWGLHQYLFHAH